MPPMDAETLRQYLEFYRDLGIKTVYRVPTAAAAAVPVGAPAVAPEVVPAPVLVEAPPMKTTAALPSLAPENDTLLKIIEDIGDCRRCKLCEGRNKIVFGSG